MSVIVGREAPVYLIPTDLSTPMPRRAIVQRTQVQLSPVYHWGSAPGAILAPGNTVAPPVAPPPPDPGTGTGSSSSNGCGCG